MFKKYLFGILLIITGLAFGGTAVTWNGSSYTVPSVGEENWFGADKVDGLLIGLANDGFQKTGGAFTLTSEVDFGGTAGLIASYWGTRSSNDSTAGIFRLSNAESIGWRNAANDANLLLTVDSSNNLTFNGTSLISSSGIVPVSSGGTGIGGGYAIGDLIYATPNSSTLTKLPVGTTDYVLKSNGTIPQYGQIVNASVDNSAAIARSKLATGTADHVVINSGAGAFSSEAQLAVSRGGTNIGSYSVGDILYATPNSSTLTRLPIGSTGNILKVAGGVPTWGSAATTSAVSSVKTSDYTIQSSDDLILVSPTSGTVILSLPLASANSGKVYHIERPAIGTQIARVSAASGDTLDGSQNVLLNTFGDAISIASDGSNTWRVFNDDTAVSAYCTGASGATISDSTYTIRNYATCSSDTHSAVTTGAGWKFTAPKAGFYQVSVMDGFTPDGSVGFREIALYKNNSRDSAICQVSYTGTAGKKDVCTGTRVVYLDKNTPIAIYIWQNSGGTEDLVNDGAFQWVSISKIGN